MHVKVPQKNYEQLALPYKVEREKMQTRHFKSIYRITDPVTGEEVASLVADPHSEILKMDSGLLKVVNKFLYQKDLLVYVKKLLRDLKLEFRTISRIDICVDFLKFSSGLQPANFIKNYMAGKYVKTGKGKGKAVFNNTARGIEYESLKFGSETSDVTYYLYNKSQEMKDVKNKQWIRDNWTANGWDGKHDVWRLEFSLKSNTQTIIDPETGEAFFSFKDLEIANRIEDIFKFHFDRYFRFVYGKKKCRKDRMKPLNLMSGYKFVGIRIELSDKKEADRSDKIFSKKLMSLNAEMRGHDIELGIFTNELLTYFVSNRGLNDWAERKLPDYYPSEKQQHKQFQQKQYEWSMLTQHAQDRMGWVRCYKKPALEYLYKNK